MLWQLLYMGGGGVGGGVGQTLQEGTPALLR